MSTSTCRTWMVWSRNGYADDTPSGVCTRWQRDTWDKLATSLAWYVRENVPRNPALWRCCTRTACSGKSLLCPESWPWEWIRPVHPRRPSSPSRPRAAECHAPLSGGLAASHDSLRWSHKGGSSLAHRARSASDCWTRSWNNNLGYSFIFNNEITVKETFET